MTAGWLPAREPEDFAETFAAMEREARLSELCWRDDGRSVVRRNSLFCRLCSRPDRSRVQGVRASSFAADEAQQCIDPRHFQAVDGYHRLDPEVWDRKVGQRHHYRTSADLRERDIVAQERDTEMRLGGLKQHAHVIAGHPRMNGDRHHAVAAQEWPTRAGGLVDQAAMLLELARVLEPGIRRQILLAREETSTMRP